MRPRAGPTADLPALRPQPPALDEDRAKRLVLAALGVLLFVDADAWKPRVETAASRALGMDVTVEGGLRFGLLPGPRLEVANMRIRNHGSELLFAEEADLAVRLLPLLRGELRYAGVTLHRARISIERGRDGRYNFQKAPGQAAVFGGLQLARVSFPELGVAYADKLSGSSLEGTGCRGGFSNLRHPGGAPFLARLSVSGQLACGEVCVADAAATDLELRVEATDGVFDLDPVTMRLFGGQGSGSLRMNRSVAVPTVRLVYALSKVRMEEVARTLPQGKSVGGLMDFSTTLEMRGLTRRELVSSARGEMSLSGSNLTLAGVDIDAQYAKYAASQAFNLC